MARKSQAEKHWRGLYRGRNGNWGDGNELMGVKIRKRGSKWYVYVNYHGKRKNRCVGTREAAEKVRREIEARLVLGDLAFLRDGRKPVTTFKSYAEGWLQTYAAVECKPSTSL